MLHFPSCKINLGLYVHGKRPDNYHDIETIFYPLPLCDALEIIESGKLSFQTDGIKIPDDEANNIVLKAYHLLKHDFPFLPPIDIFLLKKIPTGAGLGGGSADGTEMLKMLNKKFHLNISHQQLLEYSLQLGSDCPFFVQNTPALAFGRGEQLTPIAIDLSKYYFVVIKPELHISTAWAFSQMIPKPERKPLAEIICNPVETWRQTLINDFESPIFTKYPQIKLIKETLYDLGAEYSSMSGSGSAVYAIFENKMDIQYIRDRFPDYFVWESEKGL